MNSSANAGVELNVTKNEDEAKEMLEFNKKNSSNKKFWLRIKQLCLKI